MYAKSRVLRSFLHGSLVVRSHYKRQILQEALQLDPDMIGSVQFNQTDY